MLPNPALDEVKVSYSGGEGPATVRILNLSGAALYSQAIPGDKSGSAKIGLSKLAVGVYLVEVTSGDKKVVQRLIKE